MSIPSEKRTLNPEQIHHLWLAIINLLKQLSLNDTVSSLNSSVSINSLLPLLKDNKDESSAKKGLESADSIVQQAIKEGLLYVKPADQNQLVNGTSEIAESTVSLPLEAKHNSPSKATNGFPDHDWYCYECHQVGKSLLECNHCWRVYHSLCVQPAFDFAVKLDSESQSNDSNPVIRARNFTCPVCTLTQKYTTCSVGSRKFSHLEFNQILGYSYQRFKTKSSQISRSLLRIKELNQSPFSSTSLSSSISDSSSSTSNGASSSNCNELTTQLALQHLSFKSIDISDIEAKLDQSGYDSIGQFLGDCLSFKHMIEVTVIAASEPDGYQKRRIRDTLSRMLDACRYDLKEMLGCVDCYQNSNRPTSDRLWFCIPCDPPHMLVFAKQKGYPYWPAKVINPRDSVDLDKTSCTEFDVRFFGANHERSIIDYSNIKDINSSLSELCITKANPSLEKALSELRIHRDMLEKFAKGTFDMDSSDHVDDGHKVKRPYNRRQNNLSIKKSKNLIEDNEACSDSSAVSNTKRKNLTNSKPARIIRTRTRRNDTTESEDSSVKMEPELGNNIENNIESDHESNDIFEDAKEELSEGKNNDNDDDASTDVDETVFEAEELPKESKIQKRTRKINNTSDEEKPIVKNEVVEVKRGRGRPRKYFPENDGVSTNRNVSPTRPLAKDRRIRRSKVQYSPQSNKTNKPLINLNTSPSIPNPTPPVKTRGRKPKSLTSPLTINVSSPPLLVTNKVKGRTRRGRLPKSNSLSPVKSPIKSPVSPTKVSPSTSRANRKASLSPARISPRSSKKVTEKSQRRKQNIERQRQLIQARRKFKRELAQKVSILPRHIPPVTATKSSPAFTSSNSLSKSINSPVIPHLQKAQAPLIFNRPLIKPMLSPQASNVIPTPNGFISPSYNTPLFNFAKSQNVGIDSNLFPSLERTVPHISNQPTQLPQIKRTAIEQPVEYKPLPSSVLKPLINGEDAGEESNDSNTRPDSDSNCEENNSNRNNTNEQPQPKSISSTSNAAERSSIDDTDEEPYNYDDDQLEEQINDYLAYQEEKEIFEKQQKLQTLQFHYQQQQQYVHVQQQQFIPKMQQPMGANRLPLPNGFINSMHHLPPSNSLPPPVRNGLLEAPIKYLEYSSASIYSPTKRNQNLVNAYLHQISNNTFPSTKNDFLAQLILRKDDLDNSEAELVVNRKRGRPPKNSTGDEVVDRSAKAKSIVEKSYLQESSCNRACLNKNIKTFKKFRDFVESQKKDDTNKYKREIEELKQEVYRLKNQKEGLEVELKREQEQSKRCDPQLILQLEDRHRKQISEIKRKQWCICCDAEAAYFCCFNTNYCSPQCQNKHWIAGHKNKCTRTRNSVNNNNNNSIITANTPITNNISNHRPVENSTTPIKNVNKAS